MNDDKNVALIDTNDVESLMVNIRGQMMLLDRDVARLYNVETREINQAVRNNPDKFPLGYIVELTQEESSVLRSKILTLENSCNGRGAYSKYRYKAFTEPNPSSEDRRNTGRGNRSESFNGIYRN